MVRRLKVAEGVILNANDKVFWITIQGIEQIHTYIGLDQLRNNLYFIYDSYDAEHISKHLIFNNKLFEITCDFISSKENVVFKLCLSTKKTNHIHPEPQPLRCNFEIGRTKLKNFLFPPVVVDPSPLVG